MFKLVSLQIFVCAALILPCFAQSQPSLSGGQTSLLPGETQWEYLLIKVTQNYSQYESNLALDSLELIKQKIHSNKRFAFNSEDNNYYRRYEFAGGQAALDSLGKVGWELIAVIPQNAGESGSNQADAQFVFKRRFDAARSQREAEQQKLRETQATEKTPAQATTKKIEFVDLDRAEIVAAQKSVEAKAAARLEQALKNLKDISFADVKVRAYFQPNAEPRTQAEIVIDGSRVLLKDNKYRASEAQTYLRQIATDIFNRVGLRKSDINNDFFLPNYGYFNQNNDSPPVQIRVSLNVAVGDQTKTVAVGFISGVWADVAANK